MVHPAVRVVDEDTPLPQALTPVYPSTAGVSQAYLRKAIDNALVAYVAAGTAAGDDRARVFAAARTCRRCSTPCTRCITRAPMPTKPRSIDGTHPAWTRIKFEELLAQQLSLKRAHDERRTRAAPAMPRRSLATSRNRWSARFLKALPFTLTGAQERVLRARSRTI